tara:strand:- start:1768 stop:2082 length:315 start_codon:yes stop_codon:yes gene_type:complete
MSKKYVIISIEDVEDIDFNQVMQTDATSLRISQDATSTFVKFEGDTPSFLEGKTQYTHEEFMLIINDPEGIWMLDDTEQATLFNKLQDVVSGITWDKVNPFNWF